MSGSELGEIKKVLLSLIVSSPNNLTESKLNEDFRSVEGYPIPYRKMGYTSLDDFLKSLTDTLQVDNRGYVYAILTNESKHIDSLVSKQKKPSNRSRSQHVRPARQIYTPPTHNRQPLLPTPMTLYNQRALQHQTLFNSYMMMIQQQQNQFQMYGNRNMPTYVNNLHNHPLMTSSNFVNVANHNQFLHTPFGNNHPNSQHQSYNTHTHRNHQTTANTFNTNSDQFPSQQNDEHTTIPQPSHTKLIPAEMMSSESDDEIFMDPLSPPPQREQPSTPQQQSPPPRQQSQLPKFDPIKVLEKLSADFNTPAESCGNTNNNRSNSSGDPEKEVDRLAANMSYMDLSGDLSSLDESASMVGHTKQNQTDDAPALPQLDFDDPVFKVDVPMNAIKFGEKIPPSKLPDAITLNAQFLIFITEIHNPSRFWFHYAEKAHIIDDLMQSIEQFYQNLGANDMRLSLCSVAKGQVCAARFLELWHRGEIISECNEKRAKIFFVDYGTIDEVDIELLKYLPNDFARVPGQAYRGSVSHIHPIGHRWSRDSSYSMLSLVSNKILHCKVTNVDPETEAVSMLMIDRQGSKDLHINEALVLRGHATRFLPPPSQDYVRKLHFFEVHPTFSAIESGKYPTFGEIGEFLADGFDFHAHEDQSLIPEIDTVILALPKKRDIDDINKSVENMDRSRKSSLTSDNLKLHDKLSNHTSTDMNELDELDAIDQVKYELNYKTCRHYIQSTNPFVSEKCDMRRSTNPFDENNIYNSNTSLIVDENYNEYQTKLNPDVSPWYPN